MARSLSDQANFIIHAIVLTVTIALVAEHLPRYSPAEPQSSKSLPRTALFQQPLPWPK